MSTILVLDDEEMVVATIRAYLLLQDDFQVIAFTDPAEALEYVKTSPVDVIVTDQIMPRMSGLEFLAEVKQVQPEAIRILLTGYAHKDDAIRAINEVGLYQFLEKPWSNEQLLMVIRNGLERKRLYSSLQKKISELQIAAEDIERLKNGLVELYLEKSAETAEPGTPAAVAELRKIVGGEVRSGTRKLLFLFGIVSVLLVVSLSYIVYSSFFALRKEAAGLKIQLSEIKSRQINAAELERLRAASAAPAPRASEPAERIIAEYEGSVCFIQGTYRFRDKDSGRLLRLATTGPNAAPRVDSSGNVDLTLEGDGPPFENTSSGTGFLVTADGKVLTNRHVAEPWWGDAKLQKIVDAGFRPEFQSLTAYFPRRRDPFVLKAVKISQEADIALMEVGPTGKLPKPVPLDRDKKGAVSGGSVVLIAYPLGLEAILAKASKKELDQIPDLANLSLDDVARELARRDLILPFVTQGHLSNVTSELLVYDALTTEGGSGGPLFNYDGKVIGINFAVLSQFTGAALGIPIEYGLTLLK